jgi:hypothetical protein
VREKKSGKLDKKSKRITKKIDTMEVRKER